ncbi:MAG: ABC transporter substrate-binding protein [Nanoarchaeota archaeon]
MKTLLLLTLLLITACIQNNHSGTYKFGAALPLTGDQAFYGEYFKYGMQLAIEDINHKGGINGKKVLSLIEDTGSNKVQANSAVQKLTHTDKVDALFTVLSAAAGVMAPLAEENHIPLIYHSATDTLAQNKTFVFKEYPSAQEQCELLTQQALKDGHTHIALFGKQSDTLQLCKETAESIHPIHYEFYNPGDTDYRTTLLKFISMKATGLILATHAEDCSNIYRQMTELGYEPQLYIFFQSFSCGSQENTKNYLTALKNAYGTDISLEPTDQFGQFQKRLEERGWTTQILGSAMAYDSVMKMAQAYHNCSDSLCAAKQLQTLAYTGLTSSLQHKGQIINTPIMLTHYETGKWVKTT